MSETVIAIVHNEPVCSGSPFSEASLDVLVQVEAVETALKELGYASVRIPFARPIERFVSRIMDEKVTMAFNLCETVDEDPGFAGHPAALLELLQIPFSGSPAMALMITTDKSVTQRLLSASGIVTPRFVTYHAREPFSVETLRFPVIVKPILQDASIGIDQESIFETEKALKRRVGDLYKCFGSLLIEEYIDGREFNISLFGYPSAATLALAEIDFSDFPKGLYPIVGYRAKWDATSFEYQNTPRKFPRNLPPLLAKLMERTALECFSMLKLRDYGRVDVRVDGSDKVHVLEINANPCLSPDAGFAAAAGQSGMTYSEMVARLVSFMNQRTGKDDCQIGHAPG
jgi:D-alanine-D-alanine ligase